MMTIWALTMLFSAADHPAYAAVWTVPDSAVMAVDQAAAWAAVELFTWHIQMRQAFELTDDDAAAVASICRHLDGIPWRWNWRQHELEPCRLRRLPGGLASVSVRWTCSPTAPGTHRNASARSRRRSRGAATCCPPQHQRLLFRLSVFPVS